MNLYYDKNTGEISVGGKEFRETVKEIPEHMEL